TDSVSAETENYFLKKNDFKSGYYLPVIHAPGVDEITYLTKCYVQGTGFMFSEGFHFEVPNKDNINDILIKNNSVGLFNGNIEFECEAVGSLYPENISTASSPGGNKVYLSESSITDSNWYTLIFNEERFFIKSVNFNGSKYHGKPI